MSTLEFIVRMSEALGWPLFAAVIAFVLRRPITQMLNARQPARFKAGPFEVEWDRIVAETETEVQKDPLPPQSPAEVDRPQLRQELAAEAKQAPAVAVLEAYASVERVLREITSDMQTAPGRNYGAVALARIAHQRERISSEAVRAVEGLSVLRNLAAHGSARDITQEQAEDYLNLADTVLYALTSRPQR